MSGCEITTWGHSAIRLERDDQRLVIDPGGFSDLTVLESADAVLVTHGHPDHFSAPALLAALAADSRLEIWAPGSVAAPLLDAGAPLDRVHRASPGDEFTAAGFAVTAVGGEHAVVHPALPAVVNVGYVVDESVLHPGDSFVPAPRGGSVEVLLLPVSAPWLKIAESVDYLREIDPTVAVPIHDAILSDSGRALVDRIVTTLAGDVEYRRLGGGESLTIS